MARSDGTVIEYIIDGNNRRIGKKVNGILIKTWMYENQLRPAAEYDGAGNLIARYVYGTKINVPEYILKGGIYYRIITDHLGSVRYIVDVSTGSIVQSMEYDEYGIVTHNSNPGFTPFGYAGGIYDHETGLVRFGARDYDANSGRWTTKDPIRFNGRDVNLYRYAKNGPVNYIDPYGLGTCEYQYKVKVGADPIGEPFETETDRIGYLAALYNYGMSVFLGFALPFPPGHDQFEHTYIVELTLWQKWEWYNMFYYVCYDECGNEISRDRELKDPSGETYDATISTRYETVFLGE